MAIRKSKQMVGLLFLAFALIVAGITSCSKAEQEEVSEEAPLSEDGSFHFEGTVKIALGKYVYIPEVQGFDILVQGELDSGDIPSLTGKEVRGEGKFTLERPSLLIADSMELKDESGEYSMVFTRTEEPVLDDYLGQEARDEFVVLENLVYNRNTDWEGKEKAKVYGKIEESDGSQFIVLFDERGRQAGKIIVDNVSDFAQYYTNKLRLFESFWLYLNVKETVPWSTRRRTREMFHADVVLAGLY